MVVGNKRRRQVIGLFMSGYCEHNLHILLHFVFRNNIVLTRCVQFLRRWPPPVLFYIAYSLIQMLSKTEDFPIYQYGFDDTFFKLFNINLRLSTSGKLIRLTIIVTLSHKYLWQCFNVFLNLPRCY